MSGKMVNVLQYVFTLMKINMYIYILNHIQNDHQRRTTCGPAGLMCESPCLIVVVGADSADDTRRPTKHVVTPPPPPPPIC